MLLAGFVGLELGTLFFEPTDLDDEDRGGRGGGYFDVPSSRAHPCTDVSLIGVVAGVDAPHNGTMAVTS